MPNKLDFQELVDIIRKIILKVISANWHYIDKSETCTALPHEARLFDVAKRCNRKPATVILLFFSCLLLPPCLEALAGNYSTAKCVALKHRV